MLRLLLTVSSLALWHRLCWSWWPNHLAIVEYTFIISPTGSLCCNPGNNSSSQETSDSDFILNKLPLLPFFKYFPHSAISNSVSYSCEAADWMLGSTQCESFGVIPGCLVTTIQGHRSGRLGVGWGAPRIKGSWQVPCLSWPCRVCSVLLV